MTCKLKGSDVIGGSILGIVIALFITLMVGRVLWDYECETSYSDFDLKLKNSQPTKKKWFFEQKIKN